MRIRICKYIVTLLLLNIIYNEAKAETGVRSMVSASPEAVFAEPDSVMSSHQNFKISYRVNHHDIDTTYMSNDSNIRKLRLALTSPVDIDSIVIYSFASPEGPLQNNLRLARRRGESATDLIRKILKENQEKIDDSKIKLRTRGENWGDLYTVIERTYKGSNRERLLEILLSNMPRERQKRELKKLGSKTWHYIIHQLMPHLRSSEIVCIYHSKLMPEILEMPVETAVIVPESQPSVSSYTYLPEYEMRTRLAVRTNMLYDALTWVNFSVEVPFEINDNKFSVSYDHQFPWWRVGEGNNKYCNRYLQIGGEARWWFAPQKKPRTRKNILRECLAGHFAGVYGMGGKYDFEWGRKICYQGEFWSAGVTYGYSMPISRVFNLEFSVSLGYASIDYRHFTPSEDYGVLYRDVDKMGRLDYFGITKLGVSLVLPLNFKHKVKGKEADR